MRQLTCCAKNIVGNSTASCKLEHTYFSVPILADTRPAPAEMPSKDGATPSDEPAKPTDDKITSIRSG